jgi:archaellum component FlaC
MASGSNSLILDFHTLSGSVQDYDGRIRCQNGETGTSQRGDMSYLGRQHTFGTTTADTMVIDNKANVGMGVAPRCRLDVRIDNDVGGDNPVMILDNNSTTATTNKNVLLQFRGTSTTSVNKDLGGIRYTPNDANFINGSTLIQGRRSDAVLTSLQMNHETQEFIFRPGGLTTVNPSIYLNGRTNSGEQGVRIHYDATTNNAGGARFDLRANIGSQTMRFRADTTNGLTDMMRLEQGGNCIITLNLTVGAQAVIGTECTIGNFPATGSVDVFHNNGTLAIQPSDVRTKKDIETFENEVDELWTTITPIKYFYKTRIANQVDENGEYRKTYGLNATRLHPKIKQINKNMKVELCEYCQTREEGGTCECEQYETIDGANYCSRDIIAITIMKVKQLEDEKNSMKNEINIQNETINDMKNEIEQLSDLVQRLSSIFTMGSNMVSPPSTPRRSITPRFTDNNLQKAKEILVNQAGKPSTPSKYIIM